MDEKDSRLIEGVEQLVADDFPCFIHKSSSELATVIAPLISLGLARNERCICAFQEAEQAAVMKMLAAQGIDTDTEQARGALVMASPESLLTSTPADMSASEIIPEQLVAAAQANGFTTARLVVDMTAVLAMESSGAIVDASIFRARSLLTLCLYDMTVSPPDFLMQALRIHPIVIFGGVVCRNDLSNQPEKYRPESELQRVLQGMRTNQLILDDLRVRKFLLQTIIENTTDVICVKDPHGRFLLMNNTGAAFLGKQVEEIIGRNVTELFDPLSAEEIRAVDRKAMANNEPLTVEKTVAGIEGPRNFLTTAGPCRDEKGEVIGVFGIARDITERKRMQDELTKAQKLESLGVLAGGIAHDFNNLLTGIMGNISLARMELDPSHPAIRSLDTCESAVNRATELTRQLLTFARGGAPVKKLIEIAPLIREAVSFALRGSNVRPVIEIAEGLWSVEADWDQLCQVLHNLLFNAAQAMPGGGEVRVSVANEKLAMANPCQLTEGRYLKIEVEDCGCGIPHENLARIFDPYFTTKSQGSGLGLTSVYSIMKRHDGAVEAFSTLGVGSRFTLHLPAIIETVPKPIQPVETDKTRQTGKILFMDDEEMLRELVARILGMLGYRAETCADGEEALRLYQSALSQGKPYDAVILDLTIPGGMGGKDAAARILEVDPDAVLMVCSGYSNDPVIAEFRHYGFTGALVKPFNGKKLAGELERVILRTNIN